MEEWSRSIAGDEQRISALSPCERMKMLQSPIHICSKAENTKMWYPCHTMESFSDSY